MSGRWSNGPGDHYPAHRHDYDKVLVAESGSITFRLPERGESLELRAGDKLDLPASSHGEQRAVGAEGHAGHLPSRSNHDLGAVAPGDRSHGQLWGCDELVESRHTQQSCAVPPAASDLCTTEITPDHSDASQVGATQIRLRKVGVREPHTVQVSPLQVRVPKIAVREVLTAQVHSGQHLACSGTEPLADGQCVLFRHLGCGWVGQDICRPAAGHLVPGEVTEEVQHEGGHRPGNQGVRSFPLLEFLGRRAGHQPLHHGLVDE